MRFRYEFDLAEFEVTLAHPRRGDCARHLGASHGGHIFWRQRAVGHAGRVFAFEPQPGCYVNNTAFVPRARAGRTTP